MESSNFWPSVLHVAFCSIFDLGPLTPQIYSPKFACRSLSQPQSVDNGLCVNNIWARRGVQSPTGLLDLFCTSKIPARNLLKCAVGTPTYFVGLRSPTNKQTNQEALVRVRAVPSLRLRNLLRRNRIISICQVSLPVHVTFSLINWVKGDRWEGHGGHTDVAHGVQQRG